MIKRFNDQRDWFFEKRFGMFIHWGLYAVPAWHEQVLWRGHGWTRSKYEKLIHDFNPAEFDPDNWLDAAEAAGMEYLVFTAKHHDGFCMWHSDETDYTIANTPYGKDILSLLAEACHRRNIYLGIYYSLPDWHHPSSPNWGRHHEMFGPRPDDQPDEKVYLEYVRNQVKELLTRYGEIRAFFWDINVAGFHDPSLNDMIRELQPGAVINDRGPSPGDYSTPERQVPDGLVFEQPTEACQSMGRESWGYREGEDYFSSKFLMQSIARIMAMGGNYLLNIGPDRNGKFPQECLTGLAKIGNWYKRVRQAFRGTIPCSYMVSAKQGHMGGTYGEYLLTRRRNTFYAVLPRDPETSGLVMEGFRRKPASARLLNDGRSLGFTVDTIPWRWKELPCLRLTGLPAEENPAEPLVAELVFSDDSAG